jgi:hypothetical protein
VEKLDLKGNRREIKKKAAEKALQFYYEGLIHGDFLKRRVSHKG